MQKSIYADTGIQSDDHMLTSVQMVHPLMHFARGVPVVYDDNEQGR